MKKNIYLFGILIEFVWLVYVKFNLESLSILQYMLYSIALPALIVFLSSLSYSILNNDSKKKNYIYALISSVIMATILTVFCLLFVSTDMMNQIMLNTVASDNVQVSITQAKASDNIQSYIIFIAISGLGTLLGNKVSKKKKNELQPQDEYDNNEEI